MPAKATTYPRLVSNSGDQATVSPLPYQNATISDLDGRIVAITDEPATVTLSMRWPLYASLSAGRNGASAEAENGGVTVTGDFDLAQKTLAALAVTP